MKTFLLLISTVFCFPAYAGLSYGFDKREALDMIRLCNSFTMIDLYGSDQKILPEGYEKVYTSGTFGMDNKYQIYEKGDQAVFNIRGSTAKKISWMENINSAMIPANGTMQVEGETFRYSFANSPKAAVHSGYALGVAFLREDLLFHLRELNEKGIYNILITGHSQGGALSNMLRAYLENLPKGTIPEQNTFKTYAFAAPMVGNRAFVSEYNSRFCENQSSFNLIIPTDPIPRFPMKYSRSKEEFVVKGLKSFLSEEDSFHMEKILMDGAAMLLEDELEKYSKIISERTSEQIQKDVGKVTLPNYVEEINYEKMGNSKKLAPVPFPKILKDSSILENDSLMQVYERGTDGHFENEKLYKKEPWGYQHKPYNYYVAFLRTYYPKQYGRLEYKHLPENL